ncbi:hypothetical protein Ancab_032634 [Ancistrocladus abbreviatus]
MKKTCGGRMRETDFKRNDKLLKTNSMSSNGMKDRSSLYQTIRFMGTQTTRIILLTFLIVVSVSLSSCRHFRRTIDGQEQQIVDAEFYPPSSGHLTAAAPHDSCRDKNGQINYGVSQRTVPAGPNPLHN